MFSAEEEERDLEVYMVSNFVFLVVVCPRTPKKNNKQTNKHTNKPSTNKF
jgi:hypothetical protein